MLIQLDFDQTINLGPYPKYSEPVAGAIETIKELVKNGHEIVINTFRADIGEINKVYDWLDKYGVGASHNRAKIQPVSYIKSIQYLKKQNSLFLNTNKQVIYLDDQAPGIPITEQNGLNVVDWARVRADLEYVGMIAPAERENHPMKAVYSTPGYMKTLDEDERQAIYEEQKKKKEEQ